MFPFPHDHQSKYLGFETSSNPHQEDLMLQDLIMMPDSHEVLPSQDLQGCSLSNINIGEANINKDSTDEHERKKIMRKDIERQRRQLMAIRTASLRSLLPLEIIKGKRSISEHISEAVNYIKQLKEKIQELNGKREELRRVYKHYSTSAYDFSPEIHGNLGSRSTSNIMVSATCWGGVEIVVSTSSTNCSELEGFPLSGVLKALLAEGLTVVECASTTVNQRLFHTIQCEVDDLGCQDLPELQLKLNYFCNSG